MKKRLLSLLVALCMAVTLLPVSAITAWAEGGGQLKIVKGGYPEGSNSGSQSCSGTDWSYDKDTRTLTLSPSTPTNYDFSNNGIHTGPGNNTDCNLIIGQHATVTDGFFWGAVTNHGTITGGFFSSSVSNESNGKIENGQFGDRASSCTVTNNGGTINGGTFKDELTGSGIEPGYTLKAKTPTGYEGVLVNEYRDSCYIIPNQASVSVDIIYHFEPAINFQNLPPLDVTIDNAQPTLLSDWCESNPKIEFDGHYAYNVTFTAPPAKGSTVTISPLTWLVIDKDGYPATAQDLNGNRANYTGNGWNFDASNNTLTLESGNYDFSGEKNALRPLNPDVQLVVESGAKLTGGAFKNEPTVKGAGTFRTVTLNGTGSITAVNGLASGDWGNKLYVVPTGANTITASEPIRDINLKAIYGDDVAKLYPNQSDLYTILLNVGWLEYQGYIKENTNIVLNQGTYSTLKMADDGTPITTGLARISDGNFHTYFGNGWHSQALSGDPDNVYLESGNYNFLYTDPVNKKGENLRSVNCGIVNEGGIIEDGIFNTLVANGQPGSTSSEPHVIEGGTFAAGLLYNDGVITGGAFNGKDSILPIGIGLSGNYRSVTVNGGAIVKVNDTLPLVYNETTHDLVQSSAWDLYSYAGTVLTVKADADITNINGQEIGKAFSSIYPNDETDKTVVRFEMPDSDVELNSTKIVVPDPKPEPKPEPEPEASTYTLTVKGGTFSYNGGEAMTSASVPVDAEVKVTLNQSAVPEGMVFDLWAMDGASLLGNPAVAYNEESFTIPAGSVAKGSTVTVEAQYRDATIESEPSILGTAAIIGVAGAGTAVIVWQGYRIGMELYEKYFQPTPEETAAEQPAPEAPAAAAS
ncbi:MAG: hypothetical protein UFR61_06060 [Faecalibacterium sp.]|nr:hypothetical protein [Faecalibacterium sp.]